MKTDVDIQRDVTDQLKWEPILNAAEIGVAVKNGIVTLSGLVDTYSKKATAENAAKKVSGVKAVAENIQVGFTLGLKKTDAQIAQSVLDTYKWDTLVPDDKLSIKVEDGVVTLEGEVEWEYQRNEASKGIENLAGVRRIINLVTLKPLATAANVKQKISDAFYRSATVDASKIEVDVIGDRVILNGKVRSITEMDDAVAAVWSAPGVGVVENKLEVEEEEEVCVF